MGYVGVDDGGVAHVFAMWVAPEFRRHGVGSSLLTWIQAFAAGVGASSLYLWATLADEGVLDFYRAFCFEPTGERGTLRPGSDVPIVAMRLDL